MTTFFLVRHGEPVWNLNDIRKVKAGRRDLVPLTELGVTQAENVAQDSRFLKADIIISSPYTRALQTAAIINRFHRLPIYVEYDLHEWVPDLNWEFEDLEQLNNLIEDFQVCEGKYPPNQSKPWEETHLLKERLLAVLQQYTHFDNVIVVFHEMAIKSLVVQVSEVKHCEIVEYIL